MKTTKAILLIFLTVFAITIGCSDNDSVKVDSSPDFQSWVDEISSLPGQTFIFEGIVSDPAGIKSVNLKYDPWSLDKTILKDSFPETYELAYKFKIPEYAEENSSHTVTVTVTNAGGKKEIKNVVITLDQDVVNPVIQIAKPINGATVLIGNGFEVNLDVTVSDAELDEFKIESTLLNESIAITGTSYNYTKALDISDSGSYSFVISVTDVSGNVETETVTVNVLNDLLFDAMYITSLTDNEALNSDLFGHPYVSVPSKVAGEDGNVFTARYYSPSVNTEVRFLPQKGSFQPYTFGANPNVPGELVLGTGADVDPIILPEVGYYEVTMDLRDQSYMVTPYTPTDTPYDQVYILGRGVFVGDTSVCVNNTDDSTQCWHFKSGKPFVKDANNLFLWTLDVTVDDQPDDAGANGFILNANAAGWAPFWRVDNAEAPEATVPGGGANYIFPDSALGKDYTIIFDTHLNRLVAVLR
ncbi:hypothetical protein [Flavicella sediminum]|uniref:hypothetical protein n=1 Tax=Flavicella sediminum TaxID=2585141 RepID=UPI0011205F41|nr:hypothetical protein [Flavicella sediminum]